MSVLTGIERLNTILYDYYTFTLFVGSQKIEKSTYMNSDWNTH